MTLPAHLSEAAPDADASEGQVRLRPVGAAGRSLFFGMVGTPSQSETVTSLFRMVESALCRGHSVTVWNCGHATGLSQTTLIRPRDYFAPKGREDFNPSTAEMIQALFRRYGQDRLQWLVCRYCAEECGAVQHIPQAQVKIPFSFQYYLSAAQVSLVLGIKS
jgi:hypothetical protein